MHKRQEEEENEVNDDVEKKPSNENSSEEDKEVIRFSKAYNYDDMYVYNSQVEEPKWKIALKSILLLVVGVGLVMLTTLTNNYYFILIICHSR